jgi:hypothetical protein
MSCSVTGLTAESTSTISRSSPFCRRLKGSNTSYSLYALSMFFVPVPLSCAAPLTIDRDPVTLLARTESAARHETHVRASGCV